MSGDHEPRRRLLGDLSLLQLVAGALAAMTSAWIASYLGVAGTIVGAAVGSVVASASTAIYLNTLHQGRTIIVTDKGSVVERASAPDLDNPALDNPGRHDPEGANVTVVSAEPATTRPFRRMIVATILAFAVAIAGMVGYELFTGDSFGNSENRQIVTPNRSGPAEPPGPDSRPTRTPEPTTSPTTTPTSPPPTTEPTAPPTAAPTTEPTEAPPDPAEESIAP